MNDRLLKPLAPDADHCFPVSFGRFPFPALPFYRFGITLVLFRVLLSASLF